MEKLYKINQIEQTFSSFLSERTFCQASRSWGAKSAYFSCKMTQICMTLEMSVILSFASTIALATSLMYFVRLSTWISFTILSFWASVKFLSFLTNAVFFLMLESSLEKWDSSGRFCIAEWILFLSWALAANWVLISAIASSTAFCSKEKCYITVLKVYFE